MKWTLVDGDYVASADDLVFRLRYNKEIVTARATRRRRLGSVTKNRSASCPTDAAGAATETTERSRCESWIKENWKIPITFVSTR